MHFLAIIASHDGAQSTWLPGKRSPCGWSGELFPLIVGSFTTLREAQDDRMGELRAQPGCGLVIILPSENHARRFRLTTRVGAGKFSALSRARHGRCFAPGLR